MTCIVVDDEPLAREGMAIHLQKIPELKLIGSFGNPLEAAAMLQKTPVDLLFLDINMPEITGLDLLKTLCLGSPLAIFVTAYPQFAVDSYELDAVDYLVKPIRFERFLKAIHKAQSHLALLKMAEKASGKVPIIESADVDFFYVKADRRFFKIAFRDILYIEALKDYVILHTTTGKTVTAMNLKTMHEQLPPCDFARISKSFLVNVQRIQSFDMFNVFLSPTIDLPIGATYREDFFQNFVNEKVIKRPSEG
jgi:DNA-binding LytR/AlgR family response regulator